MFRKLSFIAFILFAPIQFVLSQEHLKENEIHFGLPHPSGKYGLGTRTYVITDSTRFDSVLKRKGRSISFQIWFPSIIHANEKIKYIPKATIQGMIKDQYNDIDSLTMNKWDTYFVKGSNKSNIIRSQKFPILFFLHGFGLSRYSYTSIIQDIASHGFVIVSLDSPHSGLMVLPGGELINTLYDNHPIEKCESMAKDVSFVMDYLQKDNHGFLKNLQRNINFREAGVLGHSLGGAAALETCRIDRRFLACEDLDGDPWGNVENTGVNRPTLILLNEPLYKPDRFKNPGSKAKWDSMGNERKTMWVSIYNRNKNVPFYAIRILGTNHFTFTDFPFLTTKYYENENAGIIINRKKGLKIISEYTTVFFKKYLENKKDSEIDALTAVYPESSFLFNP